MKRQDQLMLDLEPAIRYLRGIVEAMNRAIAQLEQLVSESSETSLPSAHRRGRKSMGSEERAQVSKRMKRYWAKRRREAAD